jgi:hypothetical protein
MQRRKLHRWSWGLRFVVLWGSLPSIVSTSGNRQKQDVLISISSIRGSEAVNHCCNKWIRTITFKRIGERPACWKAFDTRARSRPGMLPKEPSPPPHSRRADNRPSLCSRSSRALKRKAQLEVSSVHSNLDLGSGKIIAVFSDVPEAS